MRRKLILIVGPTAVGKTRLSVKIAEIIKGEIISCDSMQVYKGMRILSQAPTAEERSSVKHHLVGILPPEKEYNVSDFRKRASGIIESVLRRGKVPIVVGGSGLYVKALVDGLFPSPKEDAAFRKKMLKFAEKYGAKRLHARLAKIDPASAGGIHPNDTRRVIRALEVHHSTGRTMTELKKQTSGLKDIYPIKIFGLTKGARDNLYSAIEERVDGMFVSGVVAEVKKLAGKRISKTARAVLGFKEILGYLKGEYNIATAKDFLKINTRRFAKRQLAWFGADRRIKWFCVGNKGEEGIIREMIREIRDGARDTRHS